MNGRLILIREVTKYPQFLQIRHREELCIIIGRLRFMFF